MSNFLKEISNMWFKIIFCDIIIQSSKMFVVQNQKRCTPQRHYVFCLTKFITQHLINKFRVQNTI